MRVTITTEPRTRQKQVTGLFKKLLSKPEEITEYYVSTAIILSEEETELLKHGNISDLTLHDMPYYRPHDEFMAYAHKHGYEMARLTKQTDGLLITVGSLLKYDPYEVRFPDIVQAKKFEEVMRDRILPTLKRLLERAGSAGGTSETFEL